MPVINKLDRLSRALQDLGIDSDAKTTQHRDVAPSSSSAASVDELGFEVMGAPSVTPGGRTAILCGRGSNGEGAICTIQRGKGNKLETVSKLSDPLGKNHNMFWSGAAISPDSKRVLAQDCDGLLLSFDLTPEGQLTVKGSMEGLYDGISDIGHSPVLSPDGRRV